MRAPILPANRRRDRPAPSFGLRYLLAGHTAGYLLDAFLATARWQIVEGERHARLVESGSAFILAFWHGRLLPLGYLHRQGGHSMMISQSKDGEYGSVLARHWGQYPVRGSSTRGGGPALARMVEHAAAGHTLAFTPDGPRGPRGRVKPGTLTGAQRTGLPILPMSAGASRAWWLRSWDRMLVPKPFARIAVCYGEPFHVPAGADVEPYRAALEAELTRLTERADAACGGAPPWATEEVLEPVGPGEPGDEA